MKKKKGFIDRKRAVKFALVQQPVQTRDSVVTNHVLMPITDHRARKKMHISEEEIERLEGELSGSVLKEVPKSIWEDYDEEDKLGYDDDEFDFDGAEEVDMEALQREMEGGEEYEDDENGEYDDDDDDEHHHGEEEEELEQDSGDEQKKKQKKKKKKPQHQIFTADYGGEEGELLSQEHIDRLLRRYDRKPAANTLAMQELQKRVSAQFTEDADSGVVIVNNDDAFDPDWDPEVRTALDEFQDGEYEEFDDDFMLALMGKKDGDDADDNEEETEDGDKEESAKQQQHQQQQQQYQQQGQPQGKSNNNKRAATMSMTSSYKRPIVDREFDNEFEEFLDEYDDHKIGDLEDQAVQNDSEIRGDQNLTDIDGLIDEFLQKGAPQIKKKYTFKDLDIDGEDDEKQVRKLEGEELARLEEKLKGMGLSLVKPEDTERKKEISRKEIVDMIKRQLREQEDKEDEEDEYDYIEVKQKAQWDCESIISTYSNLENHPTLIKEPPSRSSRRRQIKLSAKTGMPLGVLDHNTRDKMQRKKDKEEEDKECDGSDSDDLYSGSDDGEYDDDDSDEPINLGEARNKKESRAEKKARKQAMKELKRIRREEKKKLKGAFTSEEKRQSKLDALPHTRQKVVIKYT